MCPLQTNIKMRLKENQVIFEICGTRRKAVPVNVGPLGFLSEMEEEVSR